MLYEQERDQNHNIVIKNLNRFKKLFQSVRQKFKLKKFKLCKEKENSKLSKEKIQVECCVKKVIRVLQVKQKTKSYILSKKSELFLGQPRPQVHCFEIKRQYL